MGSRGVTWGHVGSRGGRAGGAHLEHGGGVALRGRYGVGLLEGLLVDGLGLGALGVGVLELGDARPLECEADLGG
eukprot:6157626-Prymnesium_polylepis.1